MKKFACLLFVIISFSFFSQKYEARYYQLPPSILYGSKFLQSPYFNEQLNSFSNVKLNGPITFVGLCASEQFHFNPRNTIQNHVYYSQVLPQQIIINDSLKANLSGCQIGFGIIGMQIFKGLKNANVSITLGFNTGRLKFSGNENVMLKNGFFSPKVTLKPFFRISRFFIGAILDYEYDVSNQSWKILSNASSEQLQLQKLSHSGLTVQLNAGFMLKAKSKKDKKIAKNKKKNKKKKK